MKLLASWATIAVIAVIAAGNASAHFDSWLYTWDDCAADRQRQDPIGIVFEDYAWNRAMNHVEAHTAWDVNNGTISTMYFGGHGECGPMHAQRANGGLLETRYHLRAWRTPHDGDVVGQTVTSTPHFEDFTSDGDCNPARHATREDDANNVSGYDIARRRLGDRLADFTHHSNWRAANWGNTRGIEQCDGEFPSSNGYVRWIPIPNWVH